MVTVVVARYFPSLPAVNTATVPEIWKSPGTGAVADGPVGCDGLADADARGDDGVLADGDAEAVGAAVAAAEMPAPARAARNATAANERILMMLCSPVDVDRAPTTPAGIFQ